VSIGPVPQIIFAHLPQLKNNNLITTISATLMPYSKFTLSRAVEDFELTVQEESNLFALVQPVAPTALRQELLTENVPWA
jgi:hypothetical protein